MVEEIDPDEVYEKVSRSDDVQIVDIRQEEEYRRGHIPGAVNIPLERLPAEIAGHDWNDDIVVACPIGQSSIQAARLIDSYEGVPPEARVRSMRGGYEAWSYELETDEESGSESEAEV